jgi:plastocyanin
MGVDLIPVIRRAALLVLALGLTCAAAGWMRPPKKAVTIRDMSFQPAVIQVHVGEVVTWANNDDRDHSIVAADGSFSSGNLGAGARFSFQFNNPGQFTYSCAYHPRMKGTVIVVE